MGASDGGVDVESGNGSGGGECIRAAPYPVPYLETRTLGLSRLSPDEAAAVEKADMAGMADNIAAVDLEQAAVVVPMFRNRERTLPVAEAAVLGMAPE
jgi:hypothetical protein